MIKIGIIGATGYAGVELIRILLNHPQAELAAVSSVSFEGKAVSEVYPSLRAVRSALLLRAGGDREERRYLRLCAAWNFTGIRGAVRGEGCGLY